MSIIENSSLALKYVRFTAHLIELSTLLEKKPDIQNSVDSIRSALGVLQTDQAKINSITEQILSAALEKAAKELKTSLKIRNSIQSELDKAKTIALSAPEIQDIICGKKTERAVFSDDELLSIYGHIELESDETIDICYETIGEEAPAIIHHGLEALKIFENALGSLHKIILNINNNSVYDFPDNSITISEHLVESLRTFDSYIQQQINLQGKILNLSEDFLNYLM